jgi:hypothetical protein
MTANINITIMYQVKMTFNIINTIVLYVKMTYTCHIKITVVSQV